MKTLFFYLLTLSLLLSGTVMFAQQPKSRPSPPPPVEQGQEKPVVVNVRRVRLPITVMDGRKQLVTGLTQSDFLIFEDKVPQTIDSFTSEENNNLPLYVGVLMDTSPSTAGTSTSRAKRNRPRTSGESLWIRELWRGRVFQSV